MTRQLALPLSAPPVPTLENFVVGSNGELVARLRELAAGRPPEAVIYLWGAPGSGRSHLLAACSRPGVTVADDVEALDAAGQRALFNAINAAREEGGSVLATTSRRTPAHVGSSLRDRLRGVPGLIWTDGADGPNPYAGLLAWADRIVCTADSVNMLSEACATWVPVFVAGHEQIEGRPRRFVESVLQSGRVRALDEALEPFAVKPLRETARVAAEVRQRLRNQ